MVELNIKIKKPKDNFNSNNDSDNNYFYNDYNNNNPLDYKNHVTLNKKWSFPLRISSVNVTKSAGSCGFGHIYWRNL